MPEETPHRFFHPLTAVLALVLAALIWGYVDSRRTETKTISVPLRVTIPEGWELESRPPSAVRIALQGPQEQVRSLNVAALAVSKNVAPPAEEETETYSRDMVIDESDIRTPPGVIVVSIDPGQVSIRLARLRPEYIRIRPLLQGEPAKGYRVLRSDVEPNYFEVNVRRGEINFGDELVSYPVNISGRDSDVYQRVGVQPKRLPSGRVIRVDKGVNVSVLIEPVPEVRAFEKVPVRVLGGPRRDLRVAAIEPASVRLAVEGAKAVVEGLSEREPVVYVDLADIIGEPEGPQALRCRVKLPPEVVVREIDPFEVTVTIERR
jgi:hypothetical protein